MSLASTGVESSSKDEMPARRWPAERPAEPGFDSEESRSSLKRKDMFLNDLVNYCGVPLVPAPATEFPAIEGLESDDRVLCFQVDDVDPSVSELDIFNAWAQSLAGDKLPADITIAQQKLHCEYFRPIGDEWHLGSSQSRHIGSDAFLGKVWISE